MLIPEPLAYFFWVLVPIFLAFGCIKALKSPVYGFVLSAALLAAGLQIAKLLGFGRGHEIMGLAQVLGEEINKELLTLALLVAGTTMVANGPGSSVARSLISRVRSNSLRLTAGVVLAGLVGFGNSITAANLLTQTLSSDGKLSKLKMAIPAVACTLGCILIPCSPWWVFFKEASRIDLVPSPEVLLAPIAFALAILAQILILEPDSKKVTLRPIPPKIDLGQMLAWASFALPILFVPLSLGLMGGNVEDGVLAGILAGTAASLGVSLLLDLDGDHQILYVSSKSDSPKIAGGLLKQWPGTYLLTPRDRVLHQNPNSNASSVLALIPSNRLKKWGLQYGRLRTSLSIHLSAWQSGIRSGALAGAIVLACGLLRHYSKDLIDMSGLHFGISTSAPVVLLAMMVAIIALGVIIGNVLGTAWGTFALVATILEPVAKNDWLQCAPYNSVVLILMGLLVAVAAGINSYSPQADNVIEVAHDLDVEPEIVSDSARTIILRALAVALGISILWSAKLIILG